MKKSLLLCLLFMLSFLWMTSCEPEYPPSIWDPEDEGAPNPVITSVTPADSAYGAADTRQVVEINGENFLDDVTQNFVYFGSEQGDVVSATATQLVVTPPANFQAGLRLKIAVHGAYLFATYGGDDDPHPYKLKNPVSKVGTFDKYLPPEGICVDGQNNVFITSGNVVYKVTPAGVVSEYGIIKAKSTSNVKMGPDGAFYYVYTKYAMKTDTTGWDDTYNKLGGNLRDLDFDSNDNLYYVGDEAIYAVDKASMEETVIADVPDYVFDAVRIYNNEMYVSGVYTGADTTVSTAQFIWKYGLDVNTATLTGDPQVVLDMGMTAYPGIDITIFTFDAEGNLYIGTKASSLLCVTPAAGDYQSGEISPVYDDLIGSEVAHRFVWGTGSQYLYMSAKNDAIPDNTKVVKINLFVDGAPYHGRD